MKQSKFKRVLALFALGMIYGTMFNLPYMKYVFYDAMVEAMGVTNYELGVLLSIYSLVSIFVLVPCGWLADRYRAKPILVWSAVANGLASFLFAFNLESYTIAIIVWSISSIAGAGTLWAAVLKAVRLTSPPEEQGRAYGLWEAFCGVSATIGNFVALYAFSLYDSSVAALKSAVNSMGIMCIVGAILVQFLYDESSSQGATEEKTEKKKVSVKEMMQVFKMPKVYLSSIIVFCTYSFFANQSFLTPYSTNVLGAAVTFSGALAVFRSYGLKLIGGPLGGIIADKLKSASKLAIGCFAIMFVITLAIFNMPVGGDGVITIVTILMLVLATVCFMGRGTMWATVDEAGVPVEVTGTAISIVSIIGFSLSDVILPPLLGSWLDKYGNDGYTYIFTFLAVICIVGIAAAAAMVILNAREAKAAKARS